MSSTILITNAKVMTPTAAHERGWLYAEGNKIRLIGSGDAPELAVETTIDARGLNLIPGFIDVHVHGAVGEETMDAKPDG
ncbi:MAG: N-acetylglucosamine-6-phosphate deacetylase, partial [Anaerolineae bacterium]|nr:N-acetylglucosamine-6-phosphate deacetylase [Anaerolineae bacterium]